LVARSAIRRTTSAPPSSDRSDAFAGVGVPLWVVLPGRGSRKPVRVSDRRTMHTHLRTGHK